MDETTWSREAWDVSVSARAYNPDWWGTLTPDKEPTLWAEMRSIFEEEKALSSIPEWATVDPGRKVLLSYYVYCLDAWLKDAPLSFVVAELSWRDQLGRNWEDIAAAVYRALGDRTEIKKITVERLIHRLRWWIKSFPDFDANHEHFTGLLERLRLWREGREEALPALGEGSPLTRWLVHLLWHKLLV